MKKKYKITIIILSILIFIIFGAGTTYSIFHSSLTSNTINQNIAKFVFNTENLDQLQFSLVDLKPGITNEYPFAVSNNFSGTISDVNLQYQMTIKTYHFIPLNIELYKINGEEEELILNCDESFSRNNQNELICNGSIEEMNYSSEIKDNYKLKVKFLDEYNDASYSNLVDYINIEIKSWQKTGDL